MADIVKIQHMGEADIYLTYIGKDDYQAIKDRIYAFNLIVRKCGGIPVKDGDPRFLATIAFTSELFREDFVWQMREVLGIAVAIDFRPYWIDRKLLPPTGHVDKFDFKEMERRERERQEIENLEKIEKGIIEPEYVYPRGKLATS